MRKFTVEEEQKLDEFNKKQWKILRKIPPEFHVMIGGLAKELGGEGGCGEILAYLSDLVEEFKKPLEEYTERICKEAQDAADFQREANGV